MAERKPRRADIGVFTGTEFLQIVPPPSEPGMLYVMPPGALIWHNADNAARTFVMEMRKGGLAIEFFNTELGAGEGFAAAEQRQVAGIVVALELAGAQRTA